ncbi:MAG: glycosyltransferase family 2 protein [Pseudomonadota bacterium]
MSASSNSKPSVACVVITYNRDDFIQTCITSLLASRSDTLDVSVTVINNGSPDNTAEVLATYPPQDVTAVTNAQNMSLSQALNDGIDLGLATGADYMILLNDDTEMRPGALEEMVAVCAEVGGSIVTPLQINYREPDALDHIMLKHVQNTPDLVTDAVYHRAVKRYYPQDGMIGAAVLAACDTFKKVGYFDLMFPFYGSDDDYFVRAKRLGVPLILATQAHMLHMHGRLATTAAKSTNRGEWQKRWKTNFRGQQLIKLKQPEKSLPANYIRVLGRSVQSLPKHIGQHGLGVVGPMVTTLAELLGAYGKIRDRREEESSRVKAAG